MMIYSLRWQQASLKAIGGRLNIVNKSFFGNRSVPAKSMAKKNHEPTILIIFGATGDLVTKKIVPALFHLHQKGQLPKQFKIIGFSRKALSLSDFREHVAGIFKHNKELANKTIPKSFIDLFFYQQGAFQDMSGYEELAKSLRSIDREWGGCSNKLFYLSVPPKFYEMIATNLAGSGLTNKCSHEDGWTRVIVEKPFGKNLQTAHQIDETFGKLFKEEQIYRMDHYLAKEMMQNIVAFRFANNLLEKGWDNKGIERIEVKILENDGVEKRGAFYDGVGALRDVGQNHLLQMLALVTMDHPREFSDAAIRANRAKVLKNLKSLTLKDVKKDTFRAQYNGYENIEGVEHGSKTETYFRMKAEFGHGRFLGVPIFLEGGKGMKTSKKEIVVVFKQFEPCLYPDDKAKDYKNKIIFRFDPKERIIVRFWSKKPGYGMEMEEQELVFCYKRNIKKTKYAEEYEKLLLDCISGNQMLFVSTEEIREMWRFIDPIVCSWNSGAVLLNKYDQGTDDIRQAAKKVIGMKPAERAKIIKREIGIIGLGKMGGNIARRLAEKGWKVVGYNRSPDVTKELEKEGILGAYSVKELVQKLSKKRLIWLMVPAGKPVDNMLFSEEGILKYASKGDIIIDGGNSFFENTAERAKKAEKAGINFMDVGVSGGPGGARNGACLMIGGDKDLYAKLEPLFEDMAVEKGYGYMGGHGAGHFVKMVHNGIEYGMMQAIAEGFGLMKESKFNIDLSKAADVYNHGSVIESSLIGWLKSGYAKYGKGLNSVSGVIAHSGEGQWTVETAKKMGISVPVIEKAFQYRLDSEKNPNYIGQIVSALRNQFGWHEIK